VTQTADTGEKVTQPELVTLTIDGTENRVQRAHRMQRSRSSRTCEEMLIGLVNVRLTSWNRESGRPS
jgi:hypothetical protein